MMNKRIKKVISLFACGIVSVGVGLSIAYISTHIDFPFAEAVPSNELWTTGINNPIRFMMGDDCKGWAPDKQRLAHHATCLRAKQWDQIERMMADPQVVKDLSGGASKHNFEALARVKQCILGEIQCPARPVILSGWWWTAVAVESSAENAGEVIWMRSLVEQVENNGFSVVSTWDYSKWVVLSHYIPDLIHMAWAGEFQTVACVADPRCIAPENYDPPASLRVAEPEDAEKGTIPLWRLFATDFWGSRPLRISNSDYWWGIQHSNEWSFNPLGSEWTITPYAYPGHSYLPFSIEKFCSKIPFVPYQDRDDSVLIIAKSNDYFYGGRAPPEDCWEEFHQMKLPFKFLTTAEADDNKRPLPDGVSSTGHIPRDQYEKLAGQAKVALGIGSPRISPSVYTALCQGTPVVLPMFRESNPKEIWDTFDDDTYQHGPASLLGEPYVYIYHRDDPQEMLRQIRRARAHPIPRYIPPDMTEENQHLRVRKFLNTDWEMRYLDIMENKAGPSELDVKVYARLKEMNNLPVYQATAHLCRKRRQR